MSKIKRIKFVEGLMWPSVQGVKQNTLRKYIPGVHDFKKGEIVLGVFKDGCDIFLSIIADTETKTFGQLTDSEAQANGFENAEDAFNGMKKYYPGLKKTDTLAIIWYEILKVNGIPVVSINEYAE